MHTTEHKRKGSARIHEMPFGAQIVPDGVRFRLWAPTCNKVELLLYCGAGKSLDKNDKNAGSDVTDKSVLRKQMRREGEWFELVDQGARAGMDYKFKIDDHIEVPDPASRWQSADVHGPSRITDAGHFQWNDWSWSGKRWTETTLYELHVGTFTPEGTFAAAAERLDYLKELGVTAIELMPVADFPGLRGWGYDGVLPFAPAHTYGSPEDLKNLVQAAHARNLMIFLDVVYNHFGPEGNYLYVYAKSFFNEKHHTPWGAAINFERTEVRDFFIHNALYWLSEYNFDGLRLDAVHAIKDESTQHILEELAQRVHDGPGNLRTRHLVLENDDNAARYLKHNSNRQPRYYAAQWNDDIHHAYHVLATSESGGYYADYSSNSVELLHRALTEGFIYQGDPSAYRDGERRGEKSDHLPAHAFVSFLQNHDQIGNRAFGDRIASIADTLKLDALVAIQLLAPNIPLIFMGEEWGATTPFNYFCHLGSDLAPKVTEGRRNEFAKFAEFSDPKTREAIPDPCDENTFAASKLDWTDLKSTLHQKWYHRYENLLTLRKEYVMPLLDGLRLEQSNVKDGVICITWRQGVGKGTEGKALILMANLSDNYVDIPFDLVGMSEFTSILFTSGDDADHERRKGKLTPWHVVWLIDSDCATSPLKIAGSLTN